MSELDSSNKKGYLLSIVIPFIEKHFENTVGLLKSFPDKISVEYEVLVINNSGSYKDLETFKNAGAPIDNLTVLNTNGANLLPFNSRRLGSEKAKGKWIWYIDADDKISKLPNSTIAVLTKDNSDVIRFSERFIKDEKEFYLPYYKLSIITDDIRNKILTVPSVNWCLHPLIINRNFYMTKIFPMIKDIDVNFFYGEDTLLLRIIVSKYSTIKDVEGTLYSYDFDKGESHSVIRTKESVKFLISEFPKVSKIYSQIFTQDQLEEFEMDNFSYKDVIMYYIDDVVQHTKEEDNPAEIKKDLTKELMRVILLNNMNDAVDERKHIHKS